MSRDRVEDLGRLAVIIENILNHDIFVEERVIATNFENWFLGISPDERRDVLDRLSKAIPEIEKSLNKALMIAKGIDGLNGITSHA